VTTAEMSGPGTTALAPGERHERGPGGSPVELRRLPLRRVRPRAGQPRRTSDPHRLDELAESIRSHGVLQPIRVRVREDGYEIVAGERRWRAARCAGLEDIPAIVVDTDDDQAYVEALIENIQREGLNALDRGQALTRLRVTLGLRSWQEVGELVGITRQHVHNLLKVTRLPEAMREDVRAGALTEKHARALLWLQGRPEEQSRLWERIHAERLSGRAAEAVARSVARVAGPAASPEPPPRDLTSLVDGVVASLTAAGEEDLRRARERLTDLHGWLTRVLRDVPPAGRGGCAHPADGAAASSSPGLRRAVAAPS
jgi:ParB/RepB/Spo0J family partition protein